MAIHKSFDLEIARDGKDTPPLFRLVFSGFLSLADLRELAHLLVLVSNAARLEVLLALTAGEGHKHQIAGSLGTLASEDVARALEALHDANLVVPRRSGRQCMFRLTEAGRRSAELLKQVVANPESAPGPRAQPRVLGFRGRRPFEVAARPPDDSIDSSARLLQAFGDPVRLRLINLLSTGREVCVCHIQDALGLPRPSITRHLRCLAGSGVVAVRRGGGGPHYRLTEAAGELHHLLLSVATSLGGTSLLRRDRDRLGMRSGCKAATGGSTGQPAPPGTGDIPPRRSKTPPSAPVGRPA